jgi:hypothetical protein
MGKSLFMKTLFLFNLAARSLLPRREFRARTSVTRRSSWLLLVLVSIGLVATLRARDAAVTASATAGADYVRARGGQGKLTAQSYVFAEGRYFGGTRRDDSLGLMAFPMLAKGLAGALAKQNFFPAKDEASADLLIRVHWGTTEIFEDPEKEKNLGTMQDAVTAAKNGEGESTDMLALRMAASSLNESERSQMATVDRNAILLGYAHALEKERKVIAVTTTESTLTYELAEERYFVVLMAYDNQARLKEKKSKPLWVTRLSIRAAGTNFTEALPALAKVGSEVFGQQHDDLVRVKTPVSQPGSVKLGELEVLGTEQEKAPATPTRK